MCLRIFKPTPRRLILFLAFLLFTLSGILYILPPFQQLFGLPYLVLSDYAALIAQIIYSYILACIYAAAYIWLEAKIRQKYPHMNDIVQKKKQEQVSPPQKPVSKQEPPAIQEPLPPKRTAGKKAGKKSARK
ncbi:MAG: hypothetical protein NTY20_03635 [Candidatus Aenigmarchaeota archaeon]|nr:hypothetical protein [Candidatus Aenigmarchaeota archaeon]